MTNSHSAADKLSIFIERRFITDALALQTEAGGNQIDNDS